MRRFGPRSITALLWAVSASAFGQTLLTNGNFNTDADTNGQPDSWTSWSYGPTAFAAYKADPANDPWDFNGTPYVNAGNYGDWWTSGGGWFQIVPGAEGVAYSLSSDCGTEGWDNAAGEMRILFLDASNNELKPEAQRDVYHTAEYQANQPWSPYLMTAIAPAGTTQVKAELATWGARGSVLWDNANLVVTSVWNVDSSGSWSTGSNWLGGSPGGVDAAARFLGAISADQTVTVDGPFTLGSLGFDNTHSYVLAGTGSLTLQTSDGAAIVDVKRGSQTIGVPIRIASETKLNVLTGATLHLSAPLTIASGTSVSPSGGGVVSYESSIDVQTGASITFGNSTHMTSLTLGAAANAKVAPHGTGAAKVLTVTGLSVASDAKLDVTDNPFILDYTGATPIASVGAALHGGQLVASNPPDAQQLGYVESSKLLGPSGGTFAGETVDGSAVLVKLTFGGDATMDGAVDVSDLGALATNWQTSSDWSGGDFNYDGFVDVSDLGTLATNWQKGVVSPAGASFDEAMRSVGLGGVSVPEPASVGALGMLYLAATLRVTHRRRLARA